MKRIIFAVLLSAAISAVPLTAQEKRDMPMQGQMPSKESMPVQSHEMQGGGMDMSPIKGMHGKMMEMKKGMGGMMQGRGMMKSEEMKGMGGTMGDMSEMMADMSHMMESGKMTPEQMSEMSKMMRDMSGVMQMSEPMGRGMKRRNDSSAKLQVVTNLWREIVWDLDKFVLRLSFRRERQR